MKWTGLTGFTGLKRKSGNRFSDFLIPNPVNPVNPV
jgi:hypothetical protein